MDVFEGTCGEGIFRMWTFLRELLVRGSSVCGRCLREHVVRGSSVCGRCLREHVHGEGTFVMWTFGPEYI